MGSKQEEPPTTDSLGGWISGLTCQRALFAEAHNNLGGRTLDAQSQRIPESWVVQVTKVQVG